jgi:hypothetical protein
LGRPREHCFSHRTALNQTRVQNVNPSRICPDWPAVISRCTIGKQRMLNCETSIHPDRNGSAICIRRKIAERAVVDKARGLCANAKEVSVRVLVMDGDSVSPKRFRTCPIT